MLLIDATEGISRQDFVIFKEITEANKGIVLLVNKWDLVEKDHKSVDRYAAELRQKLAPMTDIPIFFTSNVTKQRVLKALEKAIEVAENRKQRIPTSKLNEVMLPIIENWPPPIYKGKDVKIKFITQLPTKSPAIAYHLIGETSFNHQVRCSIPCERSCKIMCIQTVEGGCIVRRSPNRGSSRCEGCCCSRCRRTRHLYGISVQSNWITNGSRHIKCYTGD
ncbi:MAG: hypothetical protein ACKO66_03970 [Flavobacteriales bacterium]